MRATITTLLSTAEAKSRAKDAEAELLRQQLNAAEVQSNEYFKAAESNAKAAIAAQGKIEAAEGGKKVWRNIAIGAGLLSLVLLIVFVGLPLARRASIGI